MAVEITIPSPGESVTEVTLGPWHKSDGDWVEKDETLVEIESDKVTLELPAPESGVLKINAEQGAEMLVGDAIGSIDPDAERPAGAGAKGASKAAAVEETAESTASVANEVATATASASSGAATSNGGAKATSVARKMAADRGVDLAKIKGTGPSGRITKSDVLAVGQPVSPAATPVGGGGGDIMTYGSRGTRREKMPRIRQRIAERLVEAQHNAAMLTTFNEADMSEVLRLRKQYKETFAEKYGVGLGFMSFFVKAATAALVNHPRVNAYIIGDEVEYHDFVDVSVAVGTDKGLVVPVLRDAHLMSFAQVESTIKDLAIRARDGKLSIDEMTGGTFTISNGGIYGSLNSTPILNPPQSAILGMHKIMNRPIEDPQNPGQIVLRPMMYLAVSYDHRIIDGEQAVKFLVHIKECIENPERMLIGL